MKNNLLKAGLLLIAAVMLIGIAFAGAASADTSMVAPEQFTSQITVNASEGGWTINPAFPVASGYYIKNESNWRYVVNDVNTKAASVYKNANLVLTDNVVFSEKVDSLGNQSYDGFTGFNGTIYGNGYKFVNFTQTPEMGDNAHGLIYNARDDCELNYVQMTDSNIDSDEYYVGGLIGCAEGSSSEIKLYRCSVTMSNVTSSGGLIGGLVGYSNGAAYGKYLTMRIAASVVDSTYVASTSAHYVGGLIGAAEDYASTYINDSLVNRCEIFAEKYGVGGTHGRRAYGSGYVQNTTVKDSKLWSASVTEGEGDLGGIIGGTGNGDHVIDGCSVENCTLEALFGVGGVIGSKGRNFVDFQSSTTTVKWTWVNGTSSIGSIVGDPHSQTVVKGTQPLHTLVYKGADVTNSSITSLGDNTFNNSVPKTLEEALADGVGSEIGHTLFAGKDYGYLTYYPVTLADPEVGGTASVNKSMARNNTMVEVTATPTEGYVFSGWTSDSQDVTFADPKSPTTTFTMPDHAVDIAATFAEPPKYSATQWNGLTKEDIAALPAIVKIVDSDTKAVINPKALPDQALNDEQLVLKNNLTLDFTGYKGTFAGVPSGSGNGLGALFGNVSIPTGKKLEIVGLNMTGVIVNSTDGGHLGGIIGTLDESDGTLNFTDCHLTNCTIQGPLTSFKGYIGGLAGSAYKANVNVDSCSLEHCDVATKGAIVGGLIGHGGVTNFTRCMVTNSTIAATNQMGVGGLAGQVRGAARFDGCIVANTSISVNVGVYGYVGGLAGYLWQGSISEVTDSRVVNCVIVSRSSVAGTGYAGGLIGIASGTVDKITGCTVENTTLAGVSGIGGLVGYVTGIVTASSGNSVKNIAVNGTDNTVNFVAGALDSGTLNCDLEGDNFIYNDTIQDTITLNTGLDDAIFWKNVSWSKASNATAGERIVTKLGLYGTSKGYGAISRYLVEYDANGATSGTVPEDDSAYDRNADVTVKGNTGSLARSGYTFNGWTDDAGTSYKEGATFAITADTTLYAQWKKNSVPSSSSGSNGGATIILTETPAATPTPVATIQPVGTSTTKPTTQPTQKSPAPFVGIIAGLGAALVIARMRR